MGRKSKPTAMKELGGNAGNRSLNKKEPKPKKKIPSPPAHVKSDTCANKEWTRMSKLLFSMKVMTEVDRTALAAYCMVYSRWVDSEKAVRKKGYIVKSPNGYPIQNPYLAVVNKCQAPQGWVDLKMEKMYNAEKYLKEAMKCK